MDVLLALSPVIVIFVMMTWLRRSADEAGIVGWCYTVLLAALYFKTGWSVVLLATLSGIVASFPISLMVCTSIFQINVMEEAGALKRLVVFMKTLAAGHRPAQVMLINVGAGTLLAALGATPVSILPPIMLAMGYSPFTAIALPAIGYDALCTYALLGVPVVVFADVVNAVSGSSFTPAQLGLFFAQYMPVVTTLIALSMLWLVGGWAELRRGWPVALLTGLGAGFIAIGMNAAGLPTLTGIVAGAGVIGLMLLFLRISGKRISDRSKLTVEERQTERGMSLWLAALPWILLVLFSLLTNYGRLGIYDVLFNRLAMPVEIVPGKPEKLRLLWQAYTWVLLATLIAVPCYRLQREQLGRVWKKTLKRVPRPAFAAAIFFSIAAVLNHSGKVPGLLGDKAAWALNPAGGVNMVQVVANTCAASFGQAYAGVAAFLGMFGGFISGSETSSIAMLTKLHFDTTSQVFPLLGPDSLLAASLLIAAVSGIGGGLASVISPAKLQNAAAVIDRIGMESQVIKSTAVIALLMVLAAALLTFVFLARLN
jgi:lactate permease